MSYPQDQKDRERAVLVQTEYDPVLPDAKTVESFERAFERLRETQRVA